MDKKISCGACEDTGVKFVPNGPDDVDKEFCDCEAGRKMMGFRKLPIATSWSCYFLTSECIPEDDECACPFAPVTVKYV